MPARYMVPSCNCFSHARFKRCSPHPPACPPGGEACLCACLLPAGLHTSQSSASKPCSIWRPAAQFIVPCYICTCYAAGRDGEKAYDCFSRAIDLLGDVPTTAGHQLPPLSQPCVETSVEGDVPLPLSADEVQFSALTWMGR